MWICFYGWKQGCEGVQAVTFNSLPVVLFITVYNSYPMIISDNQSPLGSRDLDSIFASSAK
jgi:hypothetical protein